MCITSTARRRSLNFKLLPTHLLKQPSAQQSTKSSSQDDACENGVYNMPLLKPAPKPMQSQSSTDNHGTKSQVVIRHDYHDHSTDIVADPNQIKHKAKGGVVIPFPVKLHTMLDAIERDGYAHIVSWQPHGRCFVVHKPKEFVSHIMPKYFKQSKMASFQRQLNLYGFSRLTGGLDKGGYYHELFLRGKVGLAYDINRMRVKGTGVRMPTNPDSEPNLYALPPMPLDGVTPAASSSQVARKPAPEAFNLEKRRAQLERESYEHTQKIAAAAAAVAADFAPSTEAKQSLEEDLVFFEGCPFHYLDPNALAPAPRSSFMMPPALPSLSEAKRPALAKLPSTVSESSSDDEDNIVPAFSAQSMDWEGPLTNIDKDNMDLKIKSSYDDDIEQFFAGFDMKLERYHEEIEKMSDDDDTAFGYLLERAISEN